MQASDEAGKQSSMQVFMGHSVGAMPCRGLLSGRETQGRLTYPELDNSSLRVDNAASGILVLLPGHGRVLADVRGVPVI